MRKLSRPDYPEIVRLYAAGYSLRAIGEVFGVSHEMVRIVLRQEGVSPRGRAGRTALHPVAAEVLADLSGEFAGVASLSQLHDWLGGERNDICCALNTLIIHGVVREDRGLFIVTKLRGRARTARSGRPARIPSERNKAILKLVATGAPYSAIAADMKVSVGVVAGVIHRARAVA